MLDPILLSVLACPIDKGPLLYFPDRNLLYNERLRRAYAVIDDIPDLLIDEATTFDDARHEELMGARASAIVTSTDGGES